MLLFLKHFTKNLLIFGVLTTVLGGIVVIGKYYFGDYGAGFGLLFLCAIVYLIADKSYKDAHYEMIYQKSKNKNGWQHL